MEIAWNAGITLFVFAIAIHLGGIACLGMAIYNGEFSEEILEEG